MRRAAEESEPGCKGWVQALTTRCHLAASTDEMVRPQYRALAIGGQARHTTAPCCKCLGRVQAAHLHVMDAAVCEDQADGVAKAGRRGGSCGRLFQQRSEQRRA